MVVSPGAPAAPTIRLVYRFHEGENFKPRQPYYSKILALLSLLRAAKPLPRPPELVFLVDGPVSYTVRALMAGAGEVAFVPGGSNRRSYRAMLDREARSSSSAELVWFAEDDYLYRPDALTQLVAAAEAWPGADYLTLHSPECLDTSSSRLHPRVRPRPGAEDEPDGVRVEDVDWFRIFSTTSTFGLRRRALEEDVRLLRTAPLSGGAWDTATSLLVQGLRPFGRADLRADLLPTRAGSVVATARSVSRGLTRSALSLQALRRPGRRRVFIGPDPELIHHMEKLKPLPLASSPRSAATDWAAIAADTARWATVHGYGDPALLEDYRAAGR